MSRGGNLEGYSFKQLQAVSAVAFSKSIRGAKEDLGYADHKSVSKLIDRAEANAGTRLFLRTRTGVEITPEGERVAALALRVLSTRSDQNRPANNILAQPNQVTIACPSAIGTYWLRPHIEILKRRIARHDPQIIPMIDNDSNLERDRSGEADIAIRYDDSLVVGPGTGPELGVKRLATVWFLPHVSRGYVEKNGLIHTQADALEHPFIEQEAPGLDHILRERVFGQKLDENDQPDRSHILMKTSDASVIYEAVAHHQGFAVMPTYVREVNPDIMPLEFTGPMMFPLFYYFRKDAVDSPVVRAAIEWLEECFDRNRYPYFDSVFHHPDEIDAQRQDGKVVPLFSAR